MWERLLIDLESQFDDVVRRGRDADAADLARGFLSETSWQDRARAAVGNEVSVRVIGGQRHTGTLQVVGVDWLLLHAAAAAGGHGGGPAEVIVLASAIASLEGVGVAAAPVQGLSASQRRTTASVLLRRLVRDRSIVAVTCVDGTHERGSIDLVGVDYLEVTPRSAEQPARTTGRRVLLPLPQVAAVARLG